MIVQKLNSKVDGPFELACKYFNVLSILNDLHLVKRDVQLLAYSIEKEATVSEVKKEFVKEFKTSMATVGNIISKLYALKILVKDKRVVTINPVLLFDFKEDLGMVITFKNNNGD